MQDPDPEEQWKRDLQRAWRKPAKDRTEREKDAIRRYYRTRGRQTSKVTLPKSLFERLQARAREHGMGHVEYLEDLLKKNLNEGLVDVEEVTALKARYREQVVRLERARDRYAEQERTHYEAALAAQEALENERRMVERLLVELHGYLDMCGAPTDVPLHLEFLVSSAAANTIEPAARKDTR